MSAAQFSCWHSLAASVVFVVTWGIGAIRTPASTSTLRDARGCNPTWCTVTRPTPAEYAALTAEADRLVARYADDSTALGRQCAALGATMNAHIADVRMIAYTWRATDPDGNDEPVTGDAHRAELVPGTGTVHIARGFNPLNPDRGMAAILQTARHEFAHLNGARQTEGGMDEGAQVARACGAG